MFENDDDDDDLDDKEFDDWFDTYLGWFPPELIDEAEPRQGIYDFYYGIYSRIKRDLITEVRKLMYKQYPEMELEIRQEITQEIDDIVFEAGSIFLVRLFHLLYDESQGVDLRAKYPEFNHWLEISTGPSDTFRMGELLLTDRPSLTEEQKREIVKKKKEKNFSEKKWKEMRQREYKDMLQTIVLKHYRQVENLSADGWIVYSAFLTEEYEGYRYQSDFISTFITLALPEEDIHLGYVELQKKFDKIYMERIKERKEAG